MDILVQVADGWDPASPAVWAFCNGPLGWERSRVWTNGYLVAAFFPGAEVLMVNRKITVESLAEDIAVQCLEASAWGAA